MWLWREFYCSTLEIKWFVIVDNCSRAPHLLSSRGQAYCVTPSPRFRGKGKVGEVILFERKLHILAKNT